MKQQKVHQLFEAQAELNPHATAVCDGYSAWTYRELNLASEKLANLLPPSRISEVETVLIQADRSATLVASLLAVMKADCRFLILDSGCPPRYVEKVVNIVRPSTFIALTTPEIEDQGNDFEKGTVRTSFYLYEKIKEKFVSSIPSCASPKPRHGLDELYLALTSGSSGAPKIVMGDHYPISHFLTRYSKELRLGPSDVFCMLSGIGHDPILRDIFSPLSTGSTLHVPGKDDQSTPDKLVSWLESAKVTVLHATPALVRYLLRYNGDVTLRDIRYVVIGGEFLSWRMLEKLKRLTPSADFINAYGATETPQIASHFLVKCANDESERDRAHSSFGVPIGHSLENSHLLLLNEDGLKCKVNEVGEIFVTGTQLARGYFEDAPGTANCFPTLRVDGESYRTFRTGDLGKVNDAGYIEYVGRKDSQQKVGGYRISLAEIETSLEDMESISQAKALVVESGCDGKKDLVAFIVPSADQKVASADLKAKLLDILPYYKCPSRFFPLQQIPLLANGKADLRRLEAMAVELCRPVNYERPLSSLENQLCEIWSSVLGREIDRANASSNFFEIGGSSLSAIELVNVLNREFRTKLSIADIFAYSSIREIAQYLEGGLESDQRQESIQSASHGRHQFLSNRSSLKEFSSSEQ